LDSRLPNKQSQVNKSNVLDNNMMKKQEACQLRQAIFDLS
jgi:hypothetical protein